MTRATQVFSLALNHTFINPSDVAKLSMACTQTHSDKLTHYKDLLQQSDEETTHALFMKLLANDSSISQTALLQCVCNRNNSSIEKYRSVLEHVATRGNRNYINALHLVLQLPRNGDSHTLAKEILEDIYVYPDDTDEYLFL